MRTVLMIILSGIITTTVFGQDVINPYNNSPNLPNHLIQFLLSNNTLTTYDLEFGNLSYDGEYQVEIGEFIWGNTSAFNIYYTSISIETVSFAFTPHDECAFTQSGCVSTNPERILTMPITLYDPITKTWGNLNQFAPKPPSTSNTLTTNGFVRASALGNLAALLPHTILKHTINLRCGNSVSDPIVTSIAFLYDNTRGRMRYYPFSATNSSNAGPLEYDIVFRPKLINNNNTHAYNESSNLVADYLWNGSIDYFPFIEIPNPSPCQLYGFTNPLQSQIFFSASAPQNQQYTHIWPAPYTLLHSFARSFKGNVMAGYDLLLGKLPGIKHQYFIDRNLDLTVLNTAERKLYNPSEVNVTATDIRLPSWYSFQTVRGVYPSVTQVNTDNTIENGGPYSDFRDVPVRTDLRSEDPSFPHDEAIPEDSRYASLYKLQNGSKITIEPCVSIFDAAFILEPGSTLKYENYNTQIGYYPDNISISRVAIDRNGGRLIRQYDNTLANSTLYLQNQTEVASAPNSYIVDDKILAGSNVNSGQTAGPYIASSGSSLELIAKNYVKMDNGFQAHAGAEVKIAVDPSMNIPACPPVPPSQSNGSRIRNPQIEQPDPLKSKALLSPNPIQNEAMVSLLQSGNENYIQRLQVHDVNGKLLLSKENLNTTSDLINASGLADGIYILTVTTNHQTETLKFVVNKGQ